MTAYQKLAALTALDADTALVFSKYTGQVFVTMPNVEIGDGCVLSGFTEHRDTFEEAIDAVWQRLTTLPLEEHLVYRAMSDQRKHFRWNGYMWQDLRWKPKPKEVPA